MLLRPNVAKLGEIIPVNEVMLEASLKWIIFEWTRPLNSKPIHQHFPVCAFSVCISQVFSAVFNPAMNCATKAYQNCCGTQKLNEASRTLTVKVSFSSIS